MNYIKLIFIIKNESESEIIMAMLFEANPQGFEQKNDSLIAFFEEEHFQIKQIKELLQVVPFPFTQEKVEHQNWNATWESNFEPIRVNDEVGVRAHFHAPFIDCKYDIEITPKMSFGTGHHETTRMMMEFESDIDFTNKSVFDFGCGTGVLAIYAKLKGANRVLGIDNDAWSVENSIENCQRNKCHDIEIKIDDLSLVNEQFDIILANINLNVLLATMTKLKSLLKPNGNLYLSGILESDLNQINDCVQENQLQIIAQKQKKNWIALHLK